MDGYERRPKMFAAPSTEKNIKTGYKYEYTMEIQSLYKTFSLGEHVQVVGVFMQHIHAGRDRQRK